MCFSIVVTVSYGGSLKAYLTEPPLTAPLRTLQEVVDSGLSWDFVPYGEEVEHELARSEDPVIRKFWDKKEVVPHRPDQYERVWQ